MGSFAFPLAAPLGNDTVPAPVRARQVPKEQALGRDLFFNGDKSVTPAGDYDTIEGIANLRQAVLRRLITKRGEFRFRPTYGVGAQTFVKKAMTTANIDELKHRIRENLLQDKRIDKVETIQADRLSIDGVSGLRLFVNVVANGRTLRLEPFTFTERGA